MSALPPKADIGTQSRNVRFVPKADIMQCSNRSHLWGELLVRPRLLPIYNFQMDRSDAIRLLTALVAAGMDTRAPKANVWIQKKALEVGLEGNQFASALAYAGNESWLIDAPRTGWTSLTSAGDTIARR
jgi:hypothetical protein